MGCFFYHPALGSSRGRCLSHAVLAYFSFIWGIVSLLKRSSLVLMRNPHHYIKGKLYHQEWHLSDTLFIFLGIGVILVECCPRGLRQTSSISFWGLLLHCQRWRTWITIGVGALMPVSVFFGATIVILLTETFQSHGNAVNFYHYLLVVALTGPYCQSPPCKGVELFLSLPCWSPQLRQKLTFMLIAWRAWFYFLRSLRGSLLTVFGLLT